MKVYNKRIICVLAALTVMLGAAYFIFIDETSEKNVAPVVRKVKKTKRAVRMPKRTRIVTSVSRAQQISEKPSMLELDDDEEAKLNEFSKRLLAELQEALDAEDFNKVKKLVEKLLETPPDPKFGAEGVASLLRRKAVEAMGWFGARGLPELVGLLADADNEISEAAFDQFTLALEDISLSDYDRADIVAMAARVLSDSDNLETLFMEINNMRHSVGVKLLTDIWMNGTESAKGLLKEQIEFFTGEDNIASIEDLNKWLEENPDGPDDEDLYGSDEDE